MKVDTFIEDRSRVSVEEFYKSPFKDVMEEMTSSGSEQYACSIVSYIEDQSPIARKACSEFVSAASGFAER